MNQEKYVELRKTVELKSVSLGYRELTLLQPAELEEAQAGYRFDGEGKSLMGDAQGDWQSNWLVIAEEDLTGDPVFVDLAIETLPVETLPVYTAQHGEGSWNPVLVAETFEKFVAALEMVKLLSKGRENPVELERNPLTEVEIEAALQQIAQENPKADLEFWKSWLVVEI